MRLDSLYPSTLSSAGWTAVLIQLYCRTAVPWCLLPKVLLSSAVVQTGSPIPYVRSTGSNVSKMYSRAVHSTARIRASTSAAEYPRWCPCCQKERCEGRLAPGSNRWPLNVIKTRSDVAEWPRTTWAHIDSLCPLLVYILSLIHIWRCRRRG